MNINRPFLARKLSSFPIVENVALALGALLLATFSLFLFFALSRTQINDMARHLRSTRQLSWTVAELAEESFRTRMELVEAVFRPTPERLRSVQERIFRFDHALEKTLYHIERYPGTLPASARTSFVALHSEAPNIRQMFMEVAFAIERGHPVDVVHAKVVELEELFQSVNFDELVDDVAQIQNNEVDAAESDIMELGRKSSILVSIGMIFCIFLTAVVAFLHRSAIKGKTARIQLIQASKLASLGELSAGVAHELNTPLMLVKGFNTRLRSGLKKLGPAVDPRLLDYVEEIESGAQRMQKIIVNFRDFSRLSSWDPKPSPLNQIIRRSFELLTEQLRFRDISVSLELSESDLWVTACPSRLEQVFLNLITNARDALDGLPDGREKRITVRSKGSGGFAVIEFCDSGFGVPKGIADRIFDPFFTTKPVGKGTGLGLSISHGIIREHRGKIEVGSAAEGGAQFTIELPLSTSAELDGSTGCDQAA